MCFALLEVTCFLNRNPEFRNFAQSSSLFNSANGLSFLRDADEHDAVAGCPRLDKADRDARVDSTVRHGGVYCDGRFVTRNPAFWSFFANKRSFFTKCDKPIKSLWRNSFSINANVSFGHPAPA